MGSVNDYFAFPRQPWRLAMGLKPLSLEGWIEWGEGAEAQLRDKDRLLHSRYDELVAGLPGSESGQTLVLEHLMGHLCQHFPQHYQWHGGQLRSLSTGQRWDPEAFAQPLDLAGRLVPEDLLLLQRDETGDTPCFRLTAGSLCFPSHWCLREKLGLPLAEVHGPVPGYPQQLQSRVDSYVEHLRPDRPSWRLNWAIVDTPELCLCESTPSSPLVVQEEMELPPLWVRVERQTLRRLSDRDIVFTVRTYLRPLAHVAAIPDHAAGLADHIRTMPTTTQQYKRIQPMRDPLLAYLDRCAQTDA